MTNTFSPTLHLWLTRYHAFVNEGRPSASSGAGRSLGPASGSLWDVFPFLTPNRMTGLFAGLSISGLDPDVGDVRILRYVSRTGFTPVMDGPFAGSGWQKMNGDNWARLDPTGYTPVPDLPVPTHPLDLSFSVDGTVHQTWNRHYAGRDLSVDHRLHTWWLPDGPVVTAVTFRSFSETLAPFLRPCDVEETEARLDPTCLFPGTRSPRLFGGPTVLSAGERVRLSVGAEEPQAETELPSAAASAAVNTVITISAAKPDRAPAIRSLLGVPPNSRGNLNVTSRGSHLLARPYEELDPVGNRVKLVPATLTILSPDHPCCSCEGYVAAYETLRDLFERQHTLIARYEKTFAVLKKFRDDLKAVMEDRVKPIRLRRGKSERGVSEDGIPLLRRDWQLLFTNLTETEKEYDELLLRLSPDDGSFRIRFVRLNRSSLDFQVVGWTDSLIRVAPVTIPALSHQAMRFTVFLWSGEPDAEETLQLQEKEGTDDGGF